MSPQEHGFTYIDLDRPTVGSGRLDGWLLSVKDLTDVAGMPTTLGSVHRAYVAEVTDPFIAALEEQGAQIVGKSAAPELGLRVDTEPVGLPHPDNPLWPGRTPGGSSGGAAVQVARGLLRAAHASDGGGSIRVPAAACGVVGFKPAGEQLSVPGFITRTVADAAFLHNLDLPAVRTPGRIGMLSTPLFARTEVAAPMRYALEQARAVLESRGYEVLDVEPYPQAAETFEAFRRLFSAHLADLPDARGYAAWVREMGREVTPEQLAHARAHAAQLPELLAAHWHVDAILTPMLAFDPPPRGHFLSLPHAENFAEQTRWSPWGSLFNVARLPAISLPWHLRTRPQPVGLQLGAITLSEPQLLALAQELHP
ncbi:amidase [Corynebacterium lizhenjunii]|nr:amidase [Corynebacterium lizhenjunii]